MEKYEEYIILDEINELLKYSLSNDFNEIIKAVHERTSCSIFNDNLGWKINPGLSENVKAIMNKYDVNYSMTTYPEDERIELVINQRVEDEWYIKSFTRFEDTFYSWRFIKHCWAAKDILKVFLSSNR